MNSAFDEDLGADKETRAGLFTTIAQRLGTTPQNADKDFWVCWTLDALFKAAAAARACCSKAGRPAHARSLSTAPPFQCTRSVQG